MRAHDVMTLVVFSCASAASVGPIAERKRDASMLRRESSDGLRQPPESMADSMQTSHDAHEEHERHEAHERHERDERLAEKSAAAQEPSAAATALYDPGFESHSAAGYITDYILCIICLVCAYNISRHLDSHSAVCHSAACHFVIFANMTALAFAGGGVAHHMLNMYHKLPEGPGLKWSAKNSGWLYPWFFTSVTAIGASGAVATCFTYQSRLTFCPAPPAVYMCLYTLGVVTAAYEIWVLLISEKTDTSGTATSFVCAGLGLLGFVIAHCGIDNSSNEMAEKRMHLASGMLFYSTAFIFIAFLVPEACKHVGEKRIGCPFHKDFNHNAIYHVVLMVSVVSLYLGVRRVVQQEDPTEKSTHSTDDAPQMQDDPDL